MSIKLFIFSIFILFVISCDNPNQDYPYKSWSHYNGDKMGSKYSALDQINKENVSQLKVAWKFISGELNTTRRSNMECNPLIIDDHIYLTSPNLSVHAISARDGSHIWKFDPDPNSRGTNRGLAFWRGNDTTRIFVSKRNYLYCLDAKSGQPITSFGDEGRINLKVGLNRDEDNRTSSTTPGVIFNDLYIVGVTVGEGPGVAAPGYIRAYDVRTGEMKWVFHTIPLPGEPGYESWPDGAWETSGGANAWGGFTLDESRGMVFCGTGSAAYDHWGGDRLGDNLYANCILALDANTGKKVWHYQVVHHDIWDYDIPCAPNLVQVKKDGELIDAVAQPTKMGHLFVLDRLTGEPIFPVEEVPVPQTDIPGEETSPTQPFPPESLRYSQQGFLEEDITDLTEEATVYVKSFTKDMEFGGIFRPPSRNPALILPQFNGGTDWGGAAYDPVNRMLYVNNSNEAEWISMFPATDAEQISQYDLGQRVYQARCSVCHGTDLQSGMPGAPALRDLMQIASIRTAEEIKSTIENGRGVMPRFRYLNNTEKESVISFLNNRDKAKQLDTRRMRLTFTNNVPWLATGHNEIKDDRGYPINKRPWGALSAIDMDSGKIDWQVPLGTYTKLEAMGFEPTGTFNLGGPMITAGGLIFIGATLDERFRAFDKDTGEMLWEFQLDAGAYATPATFEIDGKQYVVIAAGGGGIPGTPSGDTYYCFTL